MANIVKSSSAIPSVVMENLPIPSETAVALEALQKALDAGVTAAKNREDAKTERSLINAKKEIQLAAISAETERGIANDRNIHERRMSLIQSIGTLITSNAQALTPEIMAAAQFLLQVLREER